eukprot:5703179-Alexandrium_andersonii.AAC.1
MCIRDRVPGRSVGRGSLGGWGRRSESVGCAGMTSPWAGCQLSGHSGSVPLEGPPARRCRGVFWP